MRNPNIEDTINTARSFSSLGNQSKKLMSNLRSSMGSDPLGHVMGYTLGSRFVNNPHLFGNTLPNKTISSEYNYKMQRQFNIYNEICIAFNDARLEYRYNLNYYVPYSDVLYYKLEPTPPNPDLDIIPYSDEIFKIDCINKKYVRVEMSELYGKNYQIIYNGSSKFIPNLQDIYHEYINSFLTETPYVDVDNLSDYLKTTITYDGQEEEIYGSFSLVQVVERPPLLNSITNSILNRLETLKRKRENSFSRTSSRKKRRNTGGKTNKKRKRHIKKGKKTIKK